MPWAILIDWILWAATLAVSIALARMVYRRRDLPARLFLGMVIALAVPQVHYLAGLLVELLTSPPFEIAGEQVRLLVWSLWPVDMAAIVLFGCLTLHLTLAFPEKSRLIQAWRWSPALIYLPGAFLAVVSLSQLVLGAEGYLAFWGLERLGPSTAVLQILFVSLLMSIALVRLLILFFTRANPQVRQQLAWIIWGLALGGSLFLILGYLPTLFLQEPPAGWIPGLRQLPTLILLGAFGLSLQRYYLFNVNLVINRSIVYSILIVAITILYLALGTLVGSVLQSVLKDTSASFVTALLTTLIVALLALPLRDATQQLVDRLFLPRRADYRQWLEEFSRVLANPVALPRLLTMIADQIEGIFGPTGVAIVLKVNGESPQVVLSRGELATHPMWHEGACFAPEHPVAEKVAAQHSPLYLPWDAYQVAKHQRQVWKDVEESGVRLLIPMHLRGNLVGWFVLGVRSSGRSYAGQDVEFLGNLAEQACMVLENTRLYSEMQQRATELTLLSMVSSVISSSLDLEQVLHTIVESVTQVVSCDKSAIFELSQDGTALALRMSKGLSHLYLSKSRHIPVSDSNRSLAASTGQPLIVTDVQADPRLEELAKMAQQEGYRAVVDVPLPGREGILGILSVYYTQTHEPTTNELEVLTTFANQAAIAIENARLYATATRERDRAKHLYEQTDAALTQRVEELTAIEEISRQLAGTLDLEQVMDLVLRHSLQATQVNRGAISLCHPTEHTLRLVAQKGYPSEVGRFRTEPIPWDQGIIGRVARTGVPAIVPDVSQDADYLLGAPTTRSQLSVPIVHKDRVIGVITLESDRLTAFSADHLRFAELLADHAAVGIHNAQLFQQVMEGRDRLEAILNSTHDGVVVFDTTGQVILTNPRVQELFGPQVAQWLHSASLLDAIHTPNSPLLKFTDLDLGALTQVIEQARERPPGQTVDLAFNFQDGDRRCFIEVNVSPVLGTAGEVLGHVIVLRDMTRQRDLEQFRETLTSMMIHNLQGPLAAIISSLDTLNEVIEQDPEMARSLSEIALDSSQNLFDRTEAVLRLRRLEESQIPLYLQPLPVSGIVQSVIDEYAPLADAEGIHLQADLPLDLPLVPVDEDMIGRVFGNLVDNALKYTPAGGQVRVGVAIEPDAEPPRILCTVADTGPGIAESELGLIIDRFYRGDDSQPGRRKGMGIGLHYCKLAVEAHGGRIWVESQEGQGSAFHFALPLGSE